jgi:hypothetical protein
MVSIFIGPLLARPTKHANSAALRPILLAAAHA